MRHFFEPNSAIMAVYEGQFTDERGGVIFRRHGKGPAYRVSAETRDQMIAGYVSAYRKNLAAVAVVTILAIVGSAGVSLYFAVDPDSPLYWATIIGPIVVLLAWFLWASARARESLEQRFLTTAPVSAPLPPLEARRKALSRISYRALALAPIFGLFFILTLESGRRRVDGLGPPGLAGPRRVYCPCCRSGHSQI